MAAYQKRTEDALVAMVGHPPSGYGSSPFDLLTDQAERADERRTSLFNPAAGALTNDAPRRERPRPGSGVAPTDEDEDDEHPTAAPSGRAAV